MSITLFFQYIDLKILSLINLHLVFLLDNMIHLNCKNYHFKDNTMKKRLIILALIATLTLTEGATIANAETISTTANNVNLLSAKASVSYKAKITGNMVALRKSPNTNSGRLRLLAKGTIVTVIGSSFNAGQYSLVLQNIFLLLLYYKD